MFKNVDEAIFWIEHIKRKDRRTDLSRISSILIELGNPENSYKKIHIAGTNGKGATCEMCCAILEKQGYSVGRFVSPYILRFNERIVVNHKEIDDEALLRLSNYIYPIIENYNKVHDDIVPFFEVVTLIGFLYFKEKKVDIACIECGLGGKLDATNCINADCSIIPSVGYDHMNVLGNTLEEIAYQKLGILKEHNTLITGVDGSLHNQFIKYCNDLDVNLTFVSKSDLNAKSSFNGTTFELDGYKFNTNLVGDFEALNASLAIKAAKVICNDISNETINKALSNIFWPGRLEILSNNPLVILDGGHNISAINVVVESLKNIDDLKYNIIYTGLKDKETDKVINKLLEISNKFIVTSIDDPRCKDINELYNEVDSVNKVKISNEFEAFDYCYQLNEPMLIIGSLHFVSSLRPYLLKKLKNK